MKKYYTIQELLLKDFDISTLLHALVQSPTLEGYAFLTSRQNEKLFKEGGYIRIPKKQLQLMEANINQGSLFSRIEIPHYDIKTDEGIWFRYLDVYDKEFIEQSATAKDVERYLEWKPWMPEEYKKLSPAERFRTERRVFTTFSIDARHVFIRSDSAIFDSTFLLDPLLNKYPFLDQSHPEYSHALFLTLEGKKALHIDKKKEHKPGYTSQFKEWAKNQVHSYAPTMLEHMSYVSNSDCDRTKK